MRRYVFLYVMMLTIPLFLGLLVRQSARYAELERSVKQLEQSQEDWVESNKRLITGISLLLASERIEHIAVNELGLSKIQPEDVLQIRIKGNGVD
jgi:cell division protein FtsB